MVSKKKKEQLVEAAKRALKSGELEDTFDIYVGDKYVVEQYTDRLLITDTGDEKTYWLDNSVAPELREASALSHKQII